MTEENPHIAVESTLISNIEPPNKKPDDYLGILIEAKIKIFDPESGDIYVEQRA